MSCNVGERFSGYPAVVNYLTCAQAQAEFELLDLQQRDIQYNNTVSVRRPPGVVDPVKHILTRSQPVLNFQTHDLATILAHIDMMHGLCANESYFYYQARAQCEGAFAIGPTHIGQRIRKSFMYLDNVQASIDQEDGAIGSFIVNPLHVPAAQGQPVNPLIETLPDQDLGTPSLGPNDLVIPNPPNYVSSFALGPTFIDGNEILGVQSVQVQPQITYTPSPQSPHTFDQLGSITMRETVFRIRTLKLDDFNAYGAVPGYVPGAVEFYLQKHDPTHATGDGRVAPDSAVHIKISATTGLLDFQSQSVDGTDDAVVEMMIRLEGPPAISLASTIPPSVIYT